MLYIKQNKYTLCVLILLFICSLIFRFKSGGVNVSSFLFALVNTSLFYIVLDIFIRLHLRFLFIGILSLLATTDIILFYLYRDTMNYGIAASIFETDGSEAVNMLGGVLPLIILSFGLFTFLLYKASVEIKLLKRIHLGFSISYLLLFILFIPIYLGFRSADRPTHLFIASFRETPHLSLASSIPVKYPFVIGDIFLYSAYFREMSNFRASAQKEKKLPDGITYDQSIPKPTKIIFIIGESALRMHMSLYGYDLKTTPFLDSLSVNTTQLTHYDNIVSPAGYTREAVKMALSFATASNNQPFLDEKNILNMANDAGYKSLWLSTQGKFGVDDSYIGMIAACAEKSVYVEGLVRDDHSLIPLLKLALVPRERQFIVLHLSGSHLNYDSRYDEIDTKSLGSVGKTIDYDKSIHHTDRLLRMIYESLESIGDDFFIYYFSDHAEVINEGHGILNRGKDQYRIPLVTIQSDTILSANKIIPQYYDPQTGILNSSNTIYILSQIMGYHIPEERVDQAKIDGRYIYQVDGSIRLFNDIPE